LGGSGSGRKPSHRCAVEECVRLPLRALQQQGVLRAHWVGAWRWPRGQSIGLTVAPVLSGGLSLTLSYTATLGGQSVPVTQETRVTWAPVFRNLRQRLHCPMCGAARNEILLPPVVPRFGCRGCYGLTYLSVREHDARVDYLRRVLPPDREPMDLDSPFLSLPRFKADMLGPLVRRDPRCPRRRVERPLDLGIRSSYDWGHAERSDNDDRVAVPR
jgi:hypothetical protein